MIDKSILKELKEALEAGFFIKVKIHTDDGRQVLSDPEKVRFIVGTKFDAHGLSEEVDYTLEVGRTYEQR